MRLSVDHTDPGFSEKIFELGVKVYCDGKLIPKVITVDDRQGYVLAYAEDENGNIAINKSVDPWEPKTIEYHGNIEIKI